MGAPESPTASIPFFYYRDLSVAQAFYKDVMGFKLVDDQRWAKLYHIGGSCFVGTVAGDKGHCKPQEQSAVLLTLVVDDAPAWHEYLEGKGVAGLTDVEEKSDIRVRCFFFKDPGGYAIEIQEFLNPDIRRIFK